MADFIFKISPNIILGEYLTVRLGQYAKEFGKHFMVILDAELQKYDVKAKVTNSLKECAIDFILVDDVKASPDTAEVERVLKLAKDARVQGIISVGSEEICNFAKTVCSFFNEQNSIYNLIDENVSPASATLPLICVPTHMKDEFLFSNRIPLVDARSRKVYLVKAQNAICKLALYDPTLSIGLTDNQVSAKFLGVLCLAIEAYISQKANFFSDTITEKALELLSSGIASTTEMAESVSPETFLAQASCMTSVAVASSSFGPASILALSINGKYRIDSSLSSAILLPYIIEDVAKYKNDRISKVAKLMKLVEADASDEDAKNALVEFVRGKIAENNLSARLKDLQLTIEQLASVAENAGSMDVVDGFPRSMNSDDLFEILKQAF